MKKVVVVFFFFKDGGNFSVVGCRSVAIGDGEIVKTGVSRDN